MATTLIINPGSSSKKYALYRGSAQVFSMRFERANDSYTLCTEANGISASCVEVTPKQFESALPQVLEAAQAALCISKPSDISAVGIRIVAPGTYFQAHKLINEKFVEQLVTKQMLAPNHIPVMLAEIAAVRTSLIDTPLIAVSDSAFHASLPLVARQYSLPMQLADSYDMHRFGYHGISVASIVRTVAGVQTIPERIVVCHIGGGVSVTALKQGKSVDTSMGFAPGSGVPMGTRSGDIDAGALLGLVSSGAVPLSGARHQLERVGGLQAMAGTADFRLLLERRANGDLAARAALDFFLYHMQKTIGSYVAALGGLDMLILTATASERSSQLRTLLCERLGFLDIIINEEANESLRGNGCITSRDSGVPVWVYKTDEMAEMNQVVETFKQKP
jgi:acetate kinase